MGRNFTICNISPNQKYFRSDYLFSTPERKSDFFTKKDRAFLTAQDDDNDVEMKDSESEGESDGKDDDNDSEMDNIESDGKSSSVDSKTIWVESSEDEKSGTSKHR